MDEINTVATTATQQTHGLNWVDLLTLGIMAVSGVFAMMRGFVKEGFVLVSLIGSSIVATKLYPVVQPWMREQMESRVAADVSAWLGVFVLTLIVFVPITSFFVDKVQGNTMSVIDRSLGFVFGILRGLLIACLLFLLGQQFWDKPKDAPKFIKEAKTRPALELGASLLKDLVPKRKKMDGEEADPTDEAGLGEDTPDDRAAKIKKAEQVLQKLAHPEPDMNPNQPAYDEKARQHLDELIGKKPTP